MQQKQGIDTSKIDTTINAKDHFNKGDIFVVKGIAMRIKEISRRRVVTEPIKKIERPRILAPASGLVGPNNQPIRTKIR